MFILFLQSKKELKGGNQEKRVRNQECKANLFLRSICFQPIGQFVPDRFRS